MKEKKEIWNFKSELRRKAVHLLSVSFLLFYLIFGSRWGGRLALLSLTFLLIIFLELEFVRIKKQKKLPIIGVLWRESEKEKIGGQVFFLIGAIIALAVFDIRIAIAVLLMTTFGDMAAAIIGMKYGKHWLKSIPKTAWEGIIAELFINLIIGFIFFPSLIMILVVAITATFVETVFTHADDNLLIPVFAGFNGQITLIILKSIGLI